MFKEIRISNFKSINEEQLFTMEACPESEISEYPEHVVRYKGEKLLRVGSMYGPNGGGKSTLIAAINVLKCVALKMPLFVDYTDEKTNLPSMFSNSNDSIIELFVVTENYEIGYSLKIDLSNISDNNEEFYYRKRTVDVKIIHEELICRKLIDGFDFFQLYERDIEGVVKTDYLKQVDFVRNNSALHPSASFIDFIINSFSRKDENEYLKPFFELADELKNIKPISNMELIPLNLNERFARKVNPLIPLIVNVLNGFDIRVKNLVFKNNKRNETVLYIVRGTKNGKDTLLPYSSESKGTRRIINILFQIYLSDDKTVFLADDFDSYLHPKLIRAIIELFSTANSGRRQLIMNSHDFINMDNDVFRRDEIWFAYRNDDYSTTYVPLSNIQDYKGRMVRKDAKYSKQYIEGRYGADPFVKKGLSWGDK